MIGILVGCIPMLSFLPLKENTFYFILFWAHFSMRENLELYHYEQTKTGQFVHFIFLTRVIDPEIGKWSKPSVSVFHISIMLDFLEIWSLYSMQNMFGFGCYNFSSYRESKPTWPIPRPSIVNITWSPEHFR